ncbi:MAG: triose-phosphate isomerase [Myxococcales bacterium]|nr:triose-phosphate isomerase [Myxococcales bacterium]
MRRPLLIGNWKMNHGVAQTRKWFEQALSQTWPQEVELAVAPAFTSLPAAATAIGEASRKHFALAAQACHFAADGAYTGEIAVAMLAELGVRYVLVGHSERRQLFGETDELVARKTAAILAADLVPVVCVGETLAQRDGDQTFGVIEAQLAAALQGVADMSAVVIAYEPVWAIGTGRTATPAQAQDVHAHIRGLLAAAQPTAAAATRVLYGGSVKAANTSALMAGPDIDGALVGGASLVAADFAAIAAAMT